MVPMWDWVKWYQCDNGSNDTNV